MLGWNWGIPVEILPPSGARPNPLEWDLLKFNRIGLYDLRRRIGVPQEPGLYEKYRERFDAADLAWFASGLSTDVTHFNAKKFPPEFFSIREGIPSRSLTRSHIQKLTFDLVSITVFAWYLSYAFVQAALWDRAFGGATLILHVEGATRPNTPKSPEYIKAPVYFPGYLIQTDRRFSPVIYELVQKFIADIGIPVIEHWEECAQDIWPLNQVAPVPKPYPSPALQPEAQPSGSSTFLYTGHRLRVRTDPPRHMVVDEDGYEEEEITQDMVEMMNMMDQLDTYKAQLEEVQSELATTKEALAASLSSEENLRGLLLAGMDGVEGRSYVWVCI